MNTYLKHQSFDSLYRCYSLCKAPAVFTHHVPPLAHLIPHLVMYVYMYVFISTVFTNHLPPATRPYNLPPLGRLISRHSAASSFT